MQPIRILSPTLDLLAEIDDYESLSFTRRWHGVGEFELHINLYKQHTDKLVKNNLILLGRSVNKVGIIRHREISLDEAGKQSETWIVRGYELKAVVGQRITLPPAETAYDNKSGNAEMVMKHYVDRNAVNPIDSGRKINMLALAANQNRGPAVLWQSRFKNLAEELESISQFTGLGWLLSLNIQQKKWLFDVLAGRDLTTGQSQNPPVIFSPEFDSLKSLHFVDSHLAYRNAAYVAGQGEGVERRVVELGTTTGLERMELFVDARDIAEQTDSDPPVVRPVEDVIADLTERGRQKLAEFGEEIMLEGQLLTSGPFKYGVDWGLGDIVTIQNRSWGVTMDARITEVREVYEPGGFQLEATFGNSLPTLISKVKQELSQITTEVRR